MRLDAFGIGLVLLALLGCQSYEMRRQELERQTRARSDARDHLIAMNANPPAAAAPRAAPPPRPPAPVTAPAPAPAPRSGGEVEQAEASPVATAHPADKLVQLHQKAAQRYSGMDSYIARMRRIEEVGGKVRPEELVLFKFRKEPWSIYLKWLGAEGKGREAVYVKGQHDSLLHTRLAAGDVLLMPAGKVMSLSPDSPLVRANSRYPITQAGIGALIDRFEILVRQYPQNISYQGPAQKPEYAGGLEEVLQSIPPGFDELLPKGGSRRWYFDVQSGLPVLIQTWDANRQLVEMYCYDQIMHPVKLDDDDFNPSVLWKKKD